MNPNCHENNGALLLLYAIYLYPDFSLLHDDMLHREWLEYSCEPGISQRRAGHAQVCTQLPAYLLPASVRMLEETDDDL